MKQKQILGKVFAHNNEKGEIHKGSPENCFDPKCVWASNKLNRVIAKFSTPPKTWRKG